MMVPPSTVPPSTVPALDPLFGPMFEGLKDHGRVVKEGQLLPTLMSSLCWNQAQNLRAAITDPNYTINVLCSQ